MYKFKKLTALLCGAFTFACVTSPVLAAGNPYPAETAALTNAGFLSAAGAVQTEYLLSSVDGDFEYEEKDGAIEITKYIGQSPRVVIPAKIDGKPVKRIGADIIPKNVNDQVPALSDFVTEIIIEDGIEEISGGAFENCIKLTYVKLPSNLKILNGSLFYGCTSLKNVIMPKNLKYISDRVFLNCESLQSINIPQSVTVIEYSAFWGCGNLESITLPPNIYEIEYATFLYCESLTSVKIPAGVDVIGESAFQGCKNLKRIIIPDSVKKIETEAFMGCKSLTTVAIPDSVEEIKEYAFADCSNLKTVKIPDSVQKIGKYAFGVYNDKLTVSCSPDSYAYTYAKRNGIRVNGGAAANKPLSPSAAPGAPKTVNVKPNGSSSAKISWSAATGATGYELQRSTNKKTYGTIYSGAAKTFDDKNLKSGTKYYYRVRAYKTVNGKKVYGKFSKVTESAPKLAAPKNAKATALTHGAAKIDWNKVSGADGYVIERSTNKNGGFKTVKTVTAITYTDKNLKPGTTYYYRIRAYKTEGGKKIYGAYSSVFSVKAK